MAQHAEGIQHTVVVCTGSDCRKKGARELKKAARDQLKKNGCADQAMVVEAKCCGLCKQAPVACVDGADWISKAKPKSLKRELNRALLHRGSRVA